MGHRLPCRRRRRILAEEDAPIATSTRTVSTPDARSSAEPLCVAVLGNPNAGKTTLFNALTGLRGKTANFPGTTIEKRSARTRIGEHEIELIDLPGLYSLVSTNPEEEVARATLMGELAGQKRPELVLLLLDATHLERNLYLASQVLELGQPTLIALNMVDLAHREGIDVDVEQLSEELGCPVVPVVARSGRGIGRLRETIRELVSDLDRAPRPTAPEALCGCTGCPFKARYDWAEQVGQRCSGRRSLTSGEQTDRIDRVLTHPFVGVLAFFGVMFAVFSMIFWIAQYPMGWIERGFAIVGGTLNSWLPVGDLRSLVVDGVIAGVGGLLVFLPQICILFFFLSLLEDTGYMARAAFVMDRLMRRVGLPGKAFVPMLSAHACAVPGIMASRIIDDRRDRLVTILVLPLLTCSARIPVYAMLTALLFPQRPAVAATLFTGAYALGIAAALSMAFVFKRSLLPGPTRPLVIELPGYKLPSLRTALYVTYERASVFIRNAGSIILVMSIALWALATYPKSPAPAEATALLAQAREATVAGRGQLAADLETRAAAISDQHRLSQSIAGRVGRFIEPAIRPLGFDWQIGVGILSSFAAREVIVSTLAIVYGVGESGTESPSLYATLRAATRSDGTPVFTTATSISLLVFYVLAMQCVATLAVTKRETTRWRWPLFQLGYMTVLAYIGSLIVFQTLNAAGYS
ncbi:MAG: ferrous iron transport protein B [Acidobacteriota bacterium]|nr:MAG: ferrous iron transport protein B [Acidobacteriota bacterium]